ncbi:MAG TPA: HAD hydrolase-like protein [Candidatus Paceibacterota bacterium]
MAKKGKNIGFDLDDVLLNFSDPFREYLNSILNKDLKRNDIKSFYYEDQYGVSGAEMKKLVNDFYIDDNHYNALPVPGAKEVLESLSKDNKLFIITAKPDYIAEKTENWVSEYFPGLFQQIHFANHYHGDESKKRKKSDICKELEIDILVDDSLENANEVAGVGIPVLLPDRPWNQLEKVHPFVTRVYSWKEIEEKLS